MFRKKIDSISIKMQCFIFKMNINFVNRKAMSIVQPEHTNNQQKKSRIVESLP